MNVYVCLGWAHLPVVQADSLTGFNEVNWRTWFSQNAEHVNEQQMVAVATTYGAWQGASNFRFKLWHSNIERLVYRESGWISNYVDTIINANSNLQNGFMCAHVRRGNFKKACRLYDEEIASGNVIFLYFWFKLLDR